MILDSKIIKKLINHRWKIFSVILLGAVTYVGFYAAFPKSEIIGILRSENLDKKTGMPKEGNVFYELRDQLARRGIKLNFVTQDTSSQTDSRVKPALEFFVDGNSKADFAYGYNTGAPISDDIKNKFSTIGAMTYSSILIIVKKGNKSIRSGKDLIGKKIYITSSPEGKINPEKSYLDVESSLYSDNYALKDFLKKIGVTSKNTEIIDAGLNNAKPASNNEVWITKEFITGIKLSKFKDIESGELEIIELDDISGISRNLRYLKPITIPKSTYSIEKNIPSKDIHSLGITGDIIIRSDLDPGLIVALSEVAQTLYSQANTSSDIHEFPNFSQYSQFEPNPVARDFYKNGAPFLNKYLPPHLSTLVSKLAIIVLPIITILWPIFTFIPSIYGFFVRKKISRWYKELEMLEKDYFTNPQKNRTELFNLINDIEKGIRDLRLPFLHERYVQELFDARGHVDMIKQKLETAK